MDDELSEGSPGGGAAPELPDVADDDIENEEVLVVVVGAEAGTVTTAANVPLFDDDDADDVSRAGKAKCCSN